MYLRFVQIFYLRKQNFVKIRINKSVVEWHISYIECGIVRIITNFRRGPINI